MPLVDFEDLETSVRTLAWLSIPVASLMLVEKLTGHNYFSIFGGVPEITSIREGHLRCQGGVSASHSRRDIRGNPDPSFHRPLALSPALPANRAGCNGQCVRHRRHGFVQRGLDGLDGQHCRYGVMEMEGAHAVGSMGCCCGCSHHGHGDECAGLVLVRPAQQHYRRHGWFRSFLIDQTIAHFKEWWLFGTTYTAHWAPAGEVPAGDPNNMDITNHYIVQGVSGGLLKLLLFLAIIVASFKTVGRWFKSEDAESPIGILVWAVGVSLFAHCLSFVSTTYFDQIVVVWYWLLAMIASIPAWKSEAYASAPVEASVENVIDEDIPLGEKQYHGSFIF